MKLAAIIARSRRRDPQSELRDIERGGQRHAQRRPRAKTELRRQVASAGLGQRALEGPATRLTLRRVFFRYRTVAALLRAQALRVGKLRSL